MIFVSQGYDSRKRETFYRPIGGRIEFGERGAETIAREVREEIGAEIADVVYLGTLESIFTYEGKSLHEIVLLYDGCFIQPALNRDDYTVLGRDDDEILYQASWRSLDFFRSEGAPPLYPEGLLDLLLSQPTSPEASNRAEHCQDRKVP